MAELDGRTSRARDGERRWRIVAAVVVLVVVLAASAYVLWPRDPDHVLVVGDSVSQFSNEAIGAAFGGGVAVEYVTVSGYRSTDLLPLAEAAVDARAAAGEPLDRAVLLVGYNDVIYGDAMTTDLDRLVDLSARHECAIWLTLPSRPSGEPSSVEQFDPDRIDTWNDRIADLLAAHDNLHLVTDWEEAVDDSQPGELVGVDGIHPTPEGSRVLGRIMETSLRRACRFAGALG